jgi:hypothetical protein
MSTLSANGLMFISLFFIYVILYIYFLTGGHCHHKVNITKSVPKKFGNAMRDKNSKDSATTETKCDILTECICINGEKRPVPIAV